MLEWTGERYLPFIDPKISGAEIHYEHLHRYYFASRFAKEKKVLDLGCGEGYGSRILSKSAKYVVGIETDEKTIKHASCKYIRDNLKFIQGSVLEIPVEGEELFDVIVCFELLEHIKEHEKLLSEVKRLLKSEGVFIVSTPNKKVYSDDVNYKNPFHEKELYFDEFKQLLKRYFNYVYFFGQRVYAGSHMWFLTQDSKISEECVVEKRDKGFAVTDYEMKEPMYLIALVSDKEVDILKLTLRSYFTDVDNTVFNNFREHIGSLEKETENLRGSIAEKHSEINELEVSLEDRNKHIQSLEGEVSNLRNENLRINSELSSIKSSVTWKMVMKWHFFIEKIMPQGTRRRRWYDLGIIGLRTIANESWRSFWWKYREYRKKDKQTEYELWILNNEPKRDELETMKEECENFKYKPKISIIMPVYNVDQIWLEKAIDSVINQLYDNWELCIADDASTKKYTKETLEKYAKKDQRIKIKYLKENQGISGTSNEALSLATGEFVGLLDHDDELTISALYENVKLLNKHPEADMIYSDEDKLDINGKRCKPFFKPDWSPDLLLAVNYICHFTVIRKNILEETGQFRIGFEGSQDFDLFLQVMERTNRIEHIPKILYHWRMCPNSTAYNINVKDNASVKGIKALQDYLKRNNIQGKIVNESSKTNYRIEYLIDDDPLVSIIIPFKDKSDYLKRCLDSIFKKTNRTKYEILLVSNNSEEKSTFEYLNSLKGYPNLTILKCDSAFNFGAINNFAEKKANGQYLLFLNNDTEVINNDWLHYLLMHAQRKEIGCVGAKLLYPNNTIQHAGVVLGMTGMAGHVFSGLLENQWTCFGMDSWPRNYLAVTAACLMINRIKFKEVDGFNENFIMCGSDVDLCIRIYRKGYRNLYIPYARLFHYESVTRGTDVPVKDFQESWGPYLYYLKNGDPFYNPNLTLENTSCQLNRFNKANYEINYAQVKELLSNKGYNTEDE